MTIPFTDLYRMMRTDILMMSRNRVGTAGISRRLSCFLCLASVWCFVCVVDALASPAGMKSPAAQTPASHEKQALETSSVKIVFLTAIRFFQVRISPIDGPRCGFSPTCSRYGYEAIREYGPVQGIIMTGDRLIRCNPWKRPGRDYPLLPNGKLYDPVQTSVLFEPHP